MDLRDVTDPAQRVLTQIESLQADFPGYVIWGETVRGRVSYVARASGADTNPQVVISGTLERLRARLEEPVVPSDPAKPNVARVYDCLLGGPTNFAADRDEAARLLAADPRIGDLARENRAFLTRAVTCLARHGVSQFIDIGAGLPTTPNTHETAQSVNPGARVAYVDNDPVAVSHARFLLARDPGVVAVPADMRAPETILSAPALNGLINLADPVGVLLVAVLHFLTPAAAARVTASVMAAMAPGSYLVLSVGQAGPGEVSTVHRAYTAARLHHHTRADVEGYFRGLDLLPPGVTDVASWGQPAIAGRHGGGQATVLGGVARKP
ncbi:MAG TPA: SAM-dependent methyltransferase [Streptosporangiaceae bacterium]